MEKSESAAIEQTKLKVVQNWSASEKIVFRFVFLLFSLFIVFFNNGAFPLFNFIVKYPIDLLHILIPWLGTNVLNLSQTIDVRVNGSGDTTYNYVLLLFISIISAIGTLFWSVFDWKRKHYNNLYYWLTVAVRFYLALMLIHYGMVKIVKLQFPFPSLTRLSSTYGESTPMGLAWTFLGFSTGYNLFMGFAEMLAILLLFRKTVTLGAIIALATCANIMAVNYFYDVPVKILSTALVLMCLYLLVPNLKRLFNLFVKGETVKLRSIDPPNYNKKWIPKAIPVLKILVVFAPLLFVFLMLIPQKKRFDSSSKLPLYGIYEITSFDLDTNSIADSANPLPWKTLMIETKNNSSIRFVDRTKEFCKLDIDTVGKEISLRFVDDSTSVHQFSYSTNYSISDHENLKLSGKLFGKDVTMTFTKQKLPLVETGFNWINEFPNNR